MEPFILSMILLTIVNPDPNPGKFGLFFLCTLLKRENILLSCEESIPQPESATLILR
jgi:hypothetical protein